MQKQEISFSRKGISNKIDERRILMAIPLSSIRLSSINLFGAREQDAVLIVLGTSARYEYDATNKRTDVVAGYNVEVITNKGTTLVKLPLSVNDTVNNIKQYLNEHKIVRVSFVNVVGRAYAMLSNGTIKSGISITANDIKIISVDDDIISDENEVIDM